MKTREREREREREKEEEREREGVRERERKREREREGRRICLFLGSLINEPRWIQARCVNYRAKVKS